MSDPDHPSNFVHRVPLYLAEYLLLVGMVHVLGEVIDFDGLSRAQFEGWANSETGSCSILSTW